MADRSSFDLFAGLGSLGRKNFEWFDGLSPEGQKAASPFVMMRWMSGTSDEAQIIRINRCVNPYVFAGAADKSALFKLLAAAATGRSSRFSWLKNPGAKSKRLTLEVTKQYYECSTREAKTYVIAQEDLIEMSEELGWDKEEIAKLKKESDDNNDGSGVAKKPVGKSKKPVVRKRA